MASAQPESYVHRYQNKRPLGITLKDIVYVNQRKEADLRTRPLNGIQLTVY